MKPKRAKVATKSAAAINTNYSDDSEDSDTNQKPKRSAKNQNRTSRPVEPPPEFSDEVVSDNDIYDDDNRAYMKIANEVVLKNVKLPALFDPNVLPGFSALINNTSKISAASRVLEASFKVFGKRVDVVHTEARKLDHDVITRTVEDDEKKKKKPAEEEEEDDALNESLNDWAGEGGTNDPGFFSEDDEATVTQKKEKHKELKNMNVDMTMAHFDFDENVSMPSSFAMGSTSDSSFQLNDDNNLRKKLTEIAADRTVLMGSQKKTAKEIEKRLARANEAAMEYYRKEMLRRGINKGSRKESNPEEERTSEDYSQFHNSYFQFALNKKREKRHVCIDDVAATTIDHSRVYMHNEWCDEEDGMPPSPEDKNGPNDGSFLYYPNPIRTTQEDEDAEKDVDDVDILDGVLEQFQGTLELATASSHKLEEKWIEMLGLERKDLRPSNNTNISFEQTANDDFDPDKRLVDRLIIEGEDEAMKAEANRIEKIVRTLYSERIRLPGGPGNTNENSIRRQINSPPAVEIYQNEDIFFPFDQSKYITSESIDAQIAISRCYFIKHTNIKNVDSYGIPEKLFGALQNYSLPILPLNDDILKIVFTLPEYSFIKCLFTGTVAKFDYNQTCQVLSSVMIPFRIARYAEQLLNSVIHQVESSNLKQEFFDTRASRAQSTRPQSSLYLASTPTKKSRFDETVFNGEGYRYFAAVEHEKSQRYPNQMIHKENHENQIYNVASIVLSADRGVAAFFEERMIKFFSPEAIHTILAFIKFYADYRDKDISRFPCHPELPETIQKDIDELPSIDGASAECYALLDDLVIPDEPPPAATSAAPMEVDHDFDNDFDFQDAPTDFDDVPSSSQQPLTAKESQDIFASNDGDNDNDGAYEDADEFGPDFFGEPREETTGGTLDDSLAKIVRRSEIPDVPIISTRPKRNAKKIEFVDDDAHWEKPADKRTKKKKAVVREELENQHNDNLLFAPRETFANVTTSRRRTPSVSSSVSNIQEESQRMPRNQDLSLPLKISDKFGYRLELGQTIPGYADHDKLFMCVRFSDYMKKAFKPNAVLYRGKYSFLPSTSTTRQEDGFAFWLNTYRLCSNLTEAVKNESKVRKSLEAAANVNNIDGDDNNFDGISDDEYHDAVDHDFDAPSSPQPQIQPPRYSTQYAGSLIGEYQHLPDDDDEDQLDDFDFESKRDKAVTLHYSEGKFALKRAIKYILTKSRYDRTTLPDEISGIKAPAPQITDDLVATQNVSTSTPSAPKKHSRFEFIEEDDDEIIGGDNHQSRDMDIDDIEDVESDFENDSDETRMKNFKVDGFHTLKSLLFYLPEVCHPDTVRVLSVAHVFCTLCHMANENSLYFIQELHQMDGSTEATSDCRIMNLEDAEIEALESDLDEAMSSSSESETSE